MDVTVYGLHSGDGVIRYVGSTNNTKRRMSEHRSLPHLQRRLDRNVNRGFYNWLIENRERLELVVIETCSPEDRWRIEEKVTRELVPEHNRSAGKSLTLEGVTHHLIGTTQTEERRRGASQRIKGQKHHFYGKKLSAEHRAKMGRSGVLHHRAKFTEDEVREIRLACASGEKQADIARKYNTDQPTISRIHLRKSYADVEDK